MSSPRLDPGDIGTMNFPGARVTKRRPVVVVSRADYQAARPDVIVGILTSNLAAASSSTDSALLDWQQAGLHQPSAFRAYLETTLQSDVQRIGRLSDRDWIAIQACLSRAIAVD